LSDTRAGRVMRFVASRGMADEDADVVAELLSRAHHMADLVIAESSSSPELRSTAKEFLDQLEGDTFGDH
jgi:hypothetical protein